MFGVKYVYRRTLCTAFGIFSVNKPFAINHPSSTKCIPKNRFGSRLASSSQVSRSKCISHRRNHFSAKISRDLLSSAVRCLDFYTTTIVDPRQLKSVQHMFLLFASWAFRKSNIPFSSPRVKRYRVLFQLGPSSHLRSPTLKRISPPTEKFSSAFHQTLNGSVYRKMNNPPVFIDEKRSFVFNIVFR